MKPTRTALLWLRRTCIAAYLLVAMLGSRGWVLCIGPDGHLAIEASLPNECGGCLGAPEGGARGTAQHSAEELPACPCDDVALASQGLIARKSEDSRAVELDLATWSPRVVLSPASAPLARQLAAPDRCREANRAQRIRPRSRVLLV